MNREKLFNRDFILITIGGFFSALVVYSFLTTLAVYSMKTFGIGEGLAGFTASITMIGSIIGRLITGAWEGRIGRRRLAILTTVFQIVLCLIYFVPMGIGAFFVLRVFSGIMTGAIQNITASAVIDFIPPARRAEGIGYNSLSFVAAVAVGPAIGLPVIREWSYTGLWIACLAYAVASAVILALVRFKQPKPAGARQTKTPEDTGIWRIFEKSVLPLAFMIVLVTICYTTIITLLETYTIGIGLAWTAPVFFIIYSCIVVISRPLSGRLIDRRGENFVMVPVNIIYIGCLLALGFAGVAPAAYAPALIIAAAVMSALGYGVLLPSGQSIAVKHALPHAIPKIIATYFSFFDVGMAVGAFILGSVASAAGFSNMFFISVVFVLAGFAIYWRSHGRRHRAASN